MYGEQMRTRTERRSDLGSRRKQPADCSSEGSLSRLREQYVSANSGCQPRPIGDVATPAVGTDGWTEGHQREADFQRLKRVIALFEGVESGSIPKSSLSRRQQRGFRYWKQYQGLVTKAYLSKKDREAKGVDAPSLYSKKVFIATTSCKDRAFIQRLQEIGVAKLDMDTPVGADFCVVEDTADLPLTVQWALMLGGGLSNV